MKKHSPCSSRAAAVDTWSSPHHLVSWLAVSTSPGADADDAGRPRGPSSGVFVDAGDRDDARALRAVGASGWLDRRRNLRAPGRQGRLFELLRGQQQRERCGLLEQQLLAVPPPALPTSSGSGGFSSSSSSEMVPPHRGSLRAATQAALRPPCSRPSPVRAPRSPTAPVTGDQAGTGTLQAQIWAAPNVTAGGPIIVYWHGTGSSPTSEVPLAFDVNAVTAAGGVIAGFISSSRTGTTTGDTGNGVWFQSDAAFADQVVACAISQLHVDPRRIHVAGYSAGALQTVYMWFARSGYVASVISYSGGTDGANQVRMQDATNVPPLIAAHGAMGQDMFILDFAQTSAQWEGIAKQAGGFSIDCNDGGNHLFVFPDASAEPQARLAPVLPRPPVQGLARALHDAAVGVPELLHHRLTAHPPSSGRKHEAPQVREADCVRKYPSNETSARQGYEGNDCGCRRRGLVPEGRAPRARSGGDPESHPFARARRQAARVVRRGGLEPLCQLRR